MRFLPTSQCGLADKDFLYDLSFVKEQEASDPGRRILSRLLLVMTAALAGYFAFDMVGFLIWGGVYSAFRLAWSRSLQALPNQINRKTFSLLMIMSLLYGLSYIWIVWYMWCAPHTVLHYAALAAVSGAMLNTVSMRADDKLMGLIDLFLSLSTVLWMVVDFGMSGVPFEDALFFSIFAAVWAVYLLSSIADANAARLRLRRSYEIEVEQSKLQALGHLTGGVAHDFNNLLTVIMGNLDLRREADLPKEDEEELLKEVGAAARKASVLTSQLLAFSRRSALEEQVVYLSDVIGEAQVLLGRLLPVTHKLDVQLQVGLPEVCLDVGKLETVVVNLAMNARDAMPTGGDIVISTHEVNYPNGRPLPDEQHVRTGSELKPGRYLELRVCDAGSGISVENMAKVLDPYFTTKPVGKGSGLGLPMALGFAEQSGGTLEVRSIEGQGTTISLWFPVVKKSPAQ